LFLKSNNNYHHFFKYAIVSAIPLLYVYTFFLESFEA